MQSDRTAQEKQRESTCSSVGQSSGFLKLQPEGCNRDSESGNAVAPPTQPDQNGQNGGVVAVLQPLRLTIEIPAEHLAAIKRVGTIAPIKAQLRKTTREMRKWSRAKRPVKCEDCGERAKLQTHHLDYCGPTCGVCVMLCDPCHRIRTSEDLAVARGLIQAITLIAYEVEGVEIVNHGIGDDFRVRLRSGGES